MLPSTSEGSTISRRFFLGGAAATLAAASTLATASMKPLSAGARPDRLSLVSLHTGETLDVVFRNRSGYDNKALAALDHILRDWRQDEILSIDPGLFDMMADIAASLGTPARYAIISGYRSPKTNDMLRRNGGGAAKQSLHMVGQAIDLNLDGTALATLRRAAIDHAAGGVGYYPRSGFVHIDTGNVRSWGG